MSRSLAYALRLAFIAFVAAACSEDETSTASPTSPPAPVTPPVQAIVEWQAVDSTVAANSVTRIVAPAGATLTPTLDSIRVGATRVVFDGTPTSGSLTLVVPELAGDVTPVALFDSGRIVGKATLRLAAPIPSEVARKETDAFLDAIETLQNAIVADIDELAVLEEDPSTIDATVELLYTARMELRTMLDTLPAAEQAHLAQFLRQARFSEIARLLVAAEPAVSARGVSGAVFPAPGGTTDGALWELGTGYTSDRCSNIKDGEALIRKANDALGVMKTLMTIFEPELTLSYPTFQATFLVARVVGYTFDAELTRLARTTWVPRSISRGGSLAVRFRPRAARNGRVLVEPMVIVERLGGGPLETYTRSGYVAKGVWGELMRKRALDFSNIASLADRYSKQVEKIVIKRVMIEVAKWADRRLTSSTRPAMMPWGGLFRLGPTSGNGWHIEQEGNRLYLVIDKPVPQPTTLQFKVEAGTSADGECDPTPLWTITEFQNLNTFTLLPTKNVITLSVGSVFADEGESDDATVTVRNTSESPQTVTLTRGLIDPAGFRSRLSETQVSLDAWPNPGSAAKLTFHVDVEAGTLRPQKGASVAYPIIATTKDGYLACNVADVYASNRGGFQMRDASLNFRVGGGSDIKDKPAIITYGSESDAGSRSGGTISLASKDASAPGQIPLEYGKNSVWFRRSNAPDRLFSYAEFPQIPSTRDDGQSATVRTISPLVGLKIDVFRVRHNGTRNDMKALSNAICASMVP